ncbi:antibiotic biosynthesis monooxygenase [Parvularcula sp. ZS-1/3]|uniref:Antibiotic biosynthesis monooxygenase n=1 Tax=Parvularcula mediterranea TaxID=2732508 RepID=A0A7Y3RJY6_9PROT|nr:antibiotic biosynthesis monooxygenase [Parvularcula mediterranea]NNU14757.1 antibiotic biosynthesis monooxygenase [Parvularcula mediterranea]
MFARGLTPPYYAVVFSSRLADGAGYAETAERMVALAKTMEGYLGAESARSPDGFGITVSYWQDEEAIRTWKRHAEHKDAQAEGIDRFYEHYELRVARVSRAYSGPEGRRLIEKEKSDV